MSNAKIGTFEDLLEMTEPDLRPIVKRLREIVIARHPEACEVVRLGDRAASYGLGPRKMIDGYAYIMPHKNWINLGFYQGATLDDPAGLLEGTGAKLRHIKNKSIADAERPAILALIDAAVKERRAAAG